MSNDAHPGHMPSGYQQGPPVPQAPPAPLATLDSANRSYQDTDSGPQSAASAPQSPAVAPSKGKNGATGPADGKPKPHICSVCQRGFTTGGHLQRHQRIHTGVKAFKCPYPGCETRTSRQDNLQQHYRTHLSPTLRRGSGTAARQAVAAAMMAAGLKSSTSRQSRKSKGSQVGTPGSSSGASTIHGQSPYQTPAPTAQPYGGYMYDPAQHGYPQYPMPPNVSGMAQNTQSAQSSRVPSPVNGHSSATAVQQQSAHHQQFYNQQPFSPAYAYPGSYGQGYRYGAPNAIPAPYGPPSHHSLYSPNVAAEHGQQHMYNNLQNFAPHSRDAQGYNVLSQGGYASQAAMSNGYPPRTQSSTPLSGAHDELDPRYRGTAAPRAPSPQRRRLTSPKAEMLAAGVVDPSSMSSTVTNGQTAAPRASLGGMPPQYAYNGYTYQSMNQTGRDGAPVALHRNLEDTNKGGRQARTG